VFVLIGGGIFAASNLIKRFQQAQAPQDPEEYIVKTSIVVTTRDLSLGDTINESDVTLTSVPVEMAPRTAIENVGEVIGKIIKTDLVQGEMVLSHNLADPTNNIKDLSFVLSDEHVLFAFPANDLMSRESMVQRGDIIDIFATFTQKVKTVGEVNEATGEEKEPETRTFTVDSLQRVGVTAMVLEVVTEDSQPSPVGVGESESQENVGATRIRAYLLALTPRDALILKHLKDTSAIFDIVLRAPTSAVQFDLTPVTEEFIIEYYGLEILP
jgi:Flp pilus assembly protein CpaB